MWHRRLASVLIEPDDWWLSIKYPTAEEPTRATEPEPPKQKYIPVVIKITEFEQLKL